MSEEIWRSTSGESPKLVGGRRFDKLTTFMGVANQIGQLGTCDRKKVGAVIVRNGRCISWGFNGAPEGLPHCEQNGHGWGKYDHQEGLADLKTLTDAANDELVKMPNPPWDWRGAVDVLTERFGCRNATHAEANALAFAARQGISTDEATLFVGVSPCETCARLIIAAGIVTVYYDEEYRKDDGCQLLRVAGLLVQQLS